MIAQLTGSVRSIHSDRIILEVAGVGYLIHVTPTAAATLTLGNSLTIHTSMVVREDSMTLYGFIDAPSKETFELVQTVSGIGPRVALSILAHLSPEQLADAVESESVNILSGVPGIGIKRAVALFEKEGYTWDTVVKAFAEKDLGEDVALMNARLAKILQCDDYDFTNKEPRLWSPSSSDRVNDGAAVQTQTD